MWDFVGNLPSWKHVFERHVIGFVGKNGHQKGMRTNTHCWTIHVHKYINHFSSIVNIMGSLYMVIWPVITFASQSRFLGTLNDNMCDLELLMQQFMIQSKCEIIGGVGGAHNRATYLKNTIFIVSTNWCPSCKPTLGTQHK